MDVVSEEMDKITYKPGWSWSLYETPWEGWWISIRLEVIDSRHPDEVQVQNIRSPLPPFQTISQVHVWMLWRLMRIEVHEAREFYRVDGVLYDDPHAEDANIEGRVA